MTRTRRTAALAAGAAAAVLVGGVAVPAAGADDGPERHSLAGSEWMTGGNAAVNAAGFLAGQTPASATFTIPADRSCTIISGFALGEHVDPDATIQYEMWADGERVHAVEVDSQHTASVGNLDLSGVRTLELRAESASAGTEAMWPDAELVCDVEGALLRPEAPAFADLPGRHGWGTYTIPEAEGVQYYVRDLRNHSEGHELVGPGTYEATGLIHIYASADSENADHSPGVDWDWKRHFSEHPGTGALTVERDARGEYPVAEQVLTGTVGAIMGMHAPMCDDREMRLQVHGHHYDWADGDLVPVHSTATGGTVDLTAVNADGEETGLVAFTMPGEDTPITSAPGLAPFIPGGGEVIDEATVDADPTYDVGQAWGRFQSSPGAGITQAATFTIGYDRIAIPDDAVEVLFTYTTPSGEVAQQVMVPHEVVADSCDTPEDPDVPEEPEQPEQPEVPDLVPPATPPERPEPPTTTKTPRVAE